MRLYIYSNRGKIWAKILLFCLVTSFLIPSAHSHELELEPHDGHVEQAISLDVDFFTHSHDDESFSKHSHDSYQHYHLPESLIQRGSVDVEPLVKNNSLLSQDFTNIVQSQERYYTNNKP